MINAVQLGYTCEKPIRVYGGGKNHCIIIFLTYNRGFGLETLKITRFQTCRSAYVGAGRVVAFAGWAGGAGAGSGLSESRIGACDTMSRN